MRRVYFTDCEKEPYLTVKTSCIDVHYDDRLRGWWITEEITDPEQVSFIKILESVKPKDDHEMDVYANPNKDFFVGP